MNRLLTRPLVVALLALGTFLVPGAAAYALWSSTATATLTVGTAAALPAPTTPTDVKCTGTGDPLTLSWTAVANATEYRIYRAPATLLRTVSTTSTSFTEDDMGLPKANGTQSYDVVVRAFNVSGESPSSAPPTAMNFKGNKAC